MSYRLALIAIGIVVAAYWQRVLRMARKARRSTGRAANFLPPEPLGRAIRVIWVPVVVLWVAHPWITALAPPKTAALRPLLASPWLAWLGAAIALACFLASRRCWKMMGKSWRMGIDPSEQTALVTGGPFAYVRHPIYALSQAMMLATVLAIPSPLMIAAGLVHIVLLHWEARREERHLLQVHGDEYGIYCQRVRRFIPRSNRAGV